MDFALAAATAGITLIALSAISFAASAAFASPEVPFGESGKTEKAEATPAPREVSAESSGEGRDLVRTLLRDVKKAVKVADALLGLEDGASAP
ncbi:MAG: hypothetical protein QXO51_07525 [Halobacteria archaeon]